MRWLCLSGFQKCFSIICIYSIGMTVFLINPTRIYAQDKIPDKTIQDIGEIMDSAKNGLPDARANAIRESSKLARPYTGGDSDLKVVMDLFGLEADRLAFFGSEFAEERNTAENATSKSERDSAMRSLRTKILNQASDLMQMIAKDGITPDEARRLLSISKAVSQAVDDLADQRGFEEKGSFDGAKSSLQKFLTVANGIADLSKGITDRDANKLMSGFRDTIGLIESKMKSLGIATTNPLNVFEYPGALAAAQVQVVNEAFEQATEAIETIGEIIESDSPEARRRLGQVLDRIENTLSPQNFARVMLNAALDRTVARFPFVRTFQAALNPSVSGLCQFRKIGEQHKQGRFTPTAKINCRLTDALGNELVSTSYDEVKLVSIHGDSAEMYKKSHSYGECGEIFGGTWNFSFGIAYRHGFYPAIDCGNVSMEPYFSYELVVDGTQYGRLILARGPFENTYSGIPPFDLFDSSGKQIAVLNTIGNDQGIFDVAPGQYTVKYKSDRYRDARIGNEIKNAEFKDVTITAGRITRLTLPVIRSVY